MNDPNAQLEALRETCRTDPGDRDAAVKLAQAYTDIGWFNEAEDIFSKLLAGHPDDYAVLLDYGNLCFRRGNHDETLKIFKKLTRLKPSRLEGWNNLGIVQLTKGDYEAARASFEKVLEFEPDNCGALLNMGNYYDKKGETVHALEFFEKAAGVRRDFVDAWFNMGNANLKIKEYAKAIDAYKRALRIQPEFASALKNLGFACEQTHDYDEAEKYYTAALEMNKADASLYVNLGSVYSKQRKYDRAKDFFLRAVKLAPREAAGWMGLRNLSLLKGDIATYVKSTLAILHRIDGQTVAEAVRRCRELEYFSGADEILAAADTLDLSDIELEAERLIAFCRSNPRNARIAGIYRKLKTCRDPGRHVVHCLAEYEYSTGQFDSVIRRLNKTMAEPENMPDLKLLWKALLEKGEYETAQESIHAYIQSHYDCFDAWFLLARAKIALSKDREAKQCLIRALENGFTDFKAMETDSKLKNIYEKLAENPQT